MARITVDDCLEMIPNRFKLTLGFLIALNLL
ncbi:MAG: hypothetical protein RLZZ625_1088 [Pseudomonadota bacterium]